MRASYMSEVTACISPKFSTKIPVGILGYFSTAIRSASGFKSWMTVSQVHRYGRYLQLAQTYKPCLVVFDQSRVLLENEISCEVLSDALAIFMRKRHSSKNTDV
jgi:hypothetical protein